MSSNALNKIISKIQFSIYSLFAFIISGIIILYALLSYGISIPRLAISNIEAEQLYIKLDKKLILNAREINVTESNNDTKSASRINIPFIAQIINLSLQAFKEVQIDTLNVKGHKVTIRYTDTLDPSLQNLITIDGEHFNGALSYKYLDDTLLISVDSLVHTPSDIRISGKLLYEFDVHLGYSQLRFSLSNCADMEVYLKENGEELAFFAESFPFEDLAPIIKLFPLEKSITQWIVQYNNAVSHQLVEAKGIHNYNDINVLLDTLFLHAVEKDVEYTFNEALSPVNSPKVDVYFKHGILDIRPRNATYHDHTLESGNVKIDFNHQDIMLIIDLHTKTTLTQDIVDILKAYKISLPLLQENGSTNARLQIVVNLDNEDAYAVGQFFVKKSDLLFGKGKYHINNASVRLHKNLLSIDTARVAYKDLFLADVNGEIDLKDLIGDFYFDTSKVSLELSDQNRLDLANKHTNVQMHLSKDKHSFIIPQTHWQFKDINLSVQPNEIFLDEKFSSILNFQNLQVSLQDIATLYAHGSYDINQEKALVDANITHFNLLNDDVNLSAATLPINFHTLYENNVTQISVLSENTFVFNEYNISLMPTDFYINEGFLDTNRSLVHINDILRTELKLHHLLGSDEITFNLKDTSVFKDDILRIRPPFDLNYKANDQHHITIDKYQVDIRKNGDDIIDLKLNDLKKLRRHSKLMKKFDIKNGYAVLTFLDDRVGLDLTLKNFHPLLSKNGHEVKTYTIKGDYSNQTANLQINKDIDLLYRKKGKLTAKNIDFNLFPIMNYLERVDNNASDTDLELIVKTKNCNVSLGRSGRKILSDTIDVQILNDHIQAQLVHGTGGVLFESRDQNLSVFGRGLNDAFMNELFKFSTFKGGKLSFVMQGPYDDMKGLIRIDDTIIKDYTVINNTLAFFNTIPSLLTFSVPGYSKDGLEVDEMYGSFEKHGDHMRIKDTMIKSKELTITAEGESDFKKETIDVLMQVKTDLGSSAKNIPIIGYIIFGDDSVSTTVRVHGDLSDPKVESSVAKSIMAAPYNIIKRTISLPLLPFLDKDDDNISTK